MSLTAKAQGIVGEYAMSRDMIGGAIVATVVWTIFAAGATGLTPITPRGHAWAVTGSEMIASHPDLVRIALPSEVAFVSRIRSGKARFPEG